ncbi:MAG: ATP-binding protein [Myxococcales bacterium]|nr:ATP-binding protein [Myxococcales bacterium]
MTETAEILTTKVDLPGLMKVLGHNLYSTPSVAIRELVQNAHDSIGRRRLEDAADFEPRIIVRPDPANGQLIIEDSGAGLTRDEIVRYLATVGTGYTGRLRDAGRDEGLIGYFGLGFLSAFFVSRKVELFTTSYQSPDVGWCFSSAGGERYSLEAVPARAVGTKVVLTLNETFRSLGDPRVCGDLLRKYCCLLREPVHLDDADSAPINRPPPPWRLQEALPTVRRTRIEFDFVARFERRFEPICTLPLRGDGPARGLLWVQDGFTYGTTDNRNVSVFVRGMLVSRDARELLPAWAGFCGGVIEADSLTPTASREDLQRDSTYEAVAAQVAETLVSGLAALPREQPAAWRRVLMRHNESLLGAAVADDRLFELLADQLKVPTSEGELTMPVLRQRSKGRIHVSMGEGSGYEEVLFRAMQMPVVTGTRYGALPFCGLHVERRGGEVVRLGTKQGDATLFDPVSVSPAVQARLDALLGREGQAVVPTRFAPAELPVVLVPDREAALKRRIEQDEADKRITTALLGLARLYTARIDGEVVARLYVNLDSPVIDRLLHDDGPAERQAAVVVRAFADLLTDRREGLVEVDAAAAFAGLTTALMALIGAPTTAKG